MDSEKIAVVTAAGRGIGETCARRLAADGYVPVLLSKSGAAIDVAHERYGRIDAVVNNTGHPATGNLLDIGDEAWHEGLDFVLLNAVRVARLVTPIMKDQGHGSIVNVSTFSAYEPSAEFPVSSVLRAGLGSFTKLYADRHVVDGIRMNAVLPGYIDSYEVDDETKGNIPMGHPAKTTEIADTVAYLLSPAASYVTGQNVRVDGGLTNSV